MSITEEPLVISFSDSDMRKEYLRMAVGFLDTDKLTEVAPYKTFIALVSLARPKLAKQRKFEIGVKELMEEIGLSHNNYTRLEESVEYLMRTILDFNVSGKDRNPGWKKAQILGPSELKNGVVTYEFTEPVWEKLKDPVVYAYLALRGVYSFSSKHEVSLYNFFLRVLVPHYQPVILDVTLEDLKFNILKLDKEQYTSFKLLNRKIIKPTIPSINEKTKLDVSYEPLKEGRSVVAIRFNIRIKETKETPAIEDVILPEKIDNALRQLMNLGFHIDHEVQVDISDWISKHGEETVQQHLKNIISACKQQQDTLKNPGGFIRKMLYSPIVIQQDNESDFPKELLKKYMDLLKRVADQALNEMNTQAFKDFLEQDYPLDKIQTLFQSNPLLKRQKIQPDDQEAVLNSRSTIALLYGEAKTLGFVTQKRSTIEEIKSRPEAVLEQARRTLMNEEVLLKNELQNAGIKLLDMEQKALDSLLNTTL